MSTVETVLKKAQDSGKMVAEKPDFTVTELQIIANNIRQEILTMVYLAKSGHPGGALGLADIFTVLYCSILQSAHTENRADRQDRFLLSNGHVCAVQYAALAATGIIPRSDLATFRKLGSSLQGHPSSKSLPVIENASGSLGQGLSQAVGTALGLRLQGSENTVFAGISDGECQEGMTWEAAMSAAHHKLENLVVYVDYNRIQIDGRTDQVMDLGDLEGKFNAFGWNTRSADGHDINTILESFQWGRSLKNGKPTVILFDTVLGKDVSFMENNPSWHGTPPDQEAYDKGMAELKVIENNLASKN